VEFHVSLVGRDDLATEVYRQVRAAIVSGRLRPGDPLPPTRELARRLSVSRTTVMVAYDRLSGEGFVTSRVGAGTFVSDYVPSWAARSASAGAVLLPRPVWNKIPLPKAFAAKAVYDFRTGLPDMMLFPYQTWRRLMARELRAPAGHGVYGDPAGDPGLRDAIARHIGMSRSVAAIAANVIVTNGTQQALDLVARVLLAPGDRVAIEDPGYEPPRRLFESLGLRVTGVPVDTEGLVVEALPDTARLVYVTPSHQYPMGSSMSLRRRTALLDWAQRNDAAIVEDDYDSEFRYGGRPIEPLQTLDTQGRVIYVGSFSKTMLPTLRLGYVIAPTTLCAALHAAKYVADWHTPLPTQAALARFIDEGGYARHLRKMRGVYRARHEKIVNALAGHLAEHLTVVPSAAGLHVAALATRASSADIDAVAERALTAGVAIQPLSKFSVDKPAPPGILLGYGAIPATDIDEGLNRLRQSFGHAYRL
jgi:GntR family transcriptional regulator/MocR family aminotransferase